MVMKQINKQINMVKRVSAINQSLHVVSIKTPSHWTNARPTLEAPLACQARLKESLSRTLRRSAQRRDCSSPTSSLPSSTCTNIQTGESLILLDMNGYIQIYLYKDKQYSSRSSTCTNMQIGESLMFWI